MAEKAGVRVRAQEPKPECSNSCNKRKSFNPSGSVPDRILQVQRTAGNQAVQRLIRSGVLQAKLRISQPNDMYEQEADRVAEQVMRMPEPKVQQLKGREEDIQLKPLAEQISRVIQRQVGEEDEKEMSVQTKQYHEKTLRTTSGLQDQIRSLRGKGQPLPQTALNFFEPRFGYNFSQVRIHNNAHAAEIAQAANAQAFTTESDVVFGPGQYTSETNKGRKLLAHELTHVIQQNKSKIRSIQRQVSGKPQGHVLVGAAAETPTKSVSEYGNLIIKLLIQDKKRKLSIQEIVRKAAEDKAIDFASPTTAEAGVPLKTAISRRRLALIMTNTDYQKPTTTLKEAKVQGQKIQEQLKARLYTTTWKHNQSASEMVKTFNNFIIKARTGDDVAIFYSGHGEVNGIQGIDNKFVAPQVIAGWKDQALKRGFQLTLILEACHTGSTTDYIRTEESIRIQKAALAKGATKAASLASIAQKLQHIKDDLAALERAKQALLEEPLSTQLFQKKSFDKECAKKEKQIKAAWDKALPKIEKLAQQVKVLSGESLIIPTFSSKPDWLNTKQMDALDTMTNQTIEFARQALGF